MLLTAGAASSQTLQPGFQQSIVFTGLTNPTAIKFASDGRVFVAEKGGVIKVFDSISDTTPVVFADLSSRVHNFWDRGMLGLELHPDFPVTPYVYVLYALDAAIGAAPPQWNDGCPTPPGPNADGCVIGARLSRLTASGNAMSGPEVVFIEDWCQQYPSHSIGSLMFGRDGALYVSGGDGASFTFADYGQDGNPLNPCGDPPSGVGGTQTPPTAQGGALRSQDIETVGDPVTMDGAILRLDPITGHAMAGNPLLGNGVPDDDRIVAYGFRNPFRITARPDTDEIWVGDVGWGTWEEINRIPSPTTEVLNFGWPCYEGNGTQGGYDSLNLSICESLYARAGAVAPPYFTYNHSAKVVAGETCPTGSSAVSGLAFYQGGAYPSQYDGALFFSDYSRDCIWAMLPGTNGNPDPASRLTFVASAANPVQLTIGEGGDLFYPDFDGGTIRRIQYRGPTAVADANPTSGPAPLTVDFDGSASSDPDGQALLYAWDLDGDGAFDDAAVANPTYVYNASGTYTARLRVTDTDNLSDTTSLVISVSNSPPTAQITAPSPTLTWRVGEPIAFSGSATDPEDGPLPASSLTWTLIMQHCPSNCHEHVIQTFVGASGSFTAPDHDYPSYLELRLAAQDSAGATGTDSVSIYPETVDLSFETTPGGLNLTVGPTTEPAPFVRRVIIGSTNSVSAPSPQSLSGTEYVFSSWSDGGAASHDIVAPDTPTTYTATYQTSAPPQMFISDTSAVEGNSGTTSLVFTVSLSAPSSQTVTAAYATSAGTATEGVDYSRVSGQVTFDPGETAATLSVPVLGDTVDELNETLFVTLSFAANASIADGQAEGIISDDDAPPALSIADVSLNEGNAGTASAVLSVSLSAASNSTVTVAYATAGGSAAAGSDFVQTSGTLTFPAGSRMASINVPVVGDTLKESTESFTVLLSAPSNATILDATGVVKIMDDDKGRPR